MQELINFTEWFHDHYVPWGDRGEEKAFLPVSSHEGGAHTSEEVVLKYLNRDNEA